MRTYQHHEDGLRFLRRLGQPQTYRSIVFVVLAVPTGLAYWCALGSAALVDALASLPRALRREQPALRWRLALACWRGLSVWERRHTVGWLGVVLAPLDPPRRVTAALLLLKLPLGYPVVMGAVAVVVYAGLLAWLAWQRAYWLLAGVGAPALALLWAVGGVAVLLAACIAVPLLLDALVRLWGRLAAKAYNGDPKLREAETRAAAEQARAQRADQSRRELIMSVGHELRTPAASIRGHVESLLLTLEQAGTEQTSDDDVRANLVIVQREAERLGLLIDDLLALARNEADRLTLELSPFTGGELVEEVYAALAPLARRERSITLVREVEPGLPQLLGDRGRVLQVLLNLVRNAITFTPGGGMVAILLARDGDGALLAVRDTGIGIPEHELERIFERFHRVDPSRTRSSGGFGLGLAIVRELVEAMGGSVSVHSTAGLGSVFEVRLPFAQAGTLAGRPHAAQQGE